MSNQSVSKIWGVPMNQPIVNRPNLVRLYWLQFKSELIKQFRIPFAWVGTIIFPLGFYSLFGLIFGANSSEPVDSTVSASYIATYGAFGVMGVALFSFGVGVATERGQGWLRLHRITPMPPMAYFLAKIGTSLVFSTLSVLSLFTAGMLVGKVSLPIGVWLTMAGTLVFGALPFCALGLVLGYAAGPNSAPILANVIYLPIAIASGLWVPIQFLPDFMQTIAQYLPAYHYAQLALKPLGTSQGTPSWVHVLALLLFTGLCLIVAIILYNRDKGQTYG